MKERVLAEAESSPSVCFSQDVCETIFSLIRLCAGLNNSPTLFDYMKRLAHVFIRLPNETKKSTYDFVPTFEEEINSSSILLGAEFLKKIKKISEKNNEILLKRTFSKISNIRTPSLSDMEYPLLSVKSSTSLAIVFILFGCCFCQIHR